MWMSNRSPCPALAPFVELLWHYEGYSQPHSHERLLPDGRASLIIQLQSDRQDQMPLLVGARSEPMVIETAAQTAVMGVQFKPGGLFPFLGMPGSELHNETVALDLLWGTLARQLRDEVFAAATAELRFALVEQALLRVAHHAGHHPAIDYALRRFADAQAEVRPRVADLADELGLSGRYFNQLFKEHVGMSPKVFCRVRRFQAVLARVQRVVSPDWADIAAANGYYDQAHFIHEFKAFSGLTPVAYAMRATEHQNHVRL
jgi:AraC-like DNA-binding protein